MLARGRLRSSRDTNEVSLSSRLVTDLTARWYQAHLAQHARGRLLDLGCGKIPLFEAYRNYVSENVCVDWGNSLHRNNHLDIECDLTQPLPFAAGEFDTIILSDVLEHIPEPQQLWREMARVLSAQGRILLNVPFFYWLHETTARLLSVHCARPRALCHAGGSEDRAFVGPGWRAGSARRYPREKSGPRAVDWSAVGGGHPGGHPLVCRHRPGPQDFRQNFAAVPVGLRVGGGKRNRCAGHALRHLLIEVFELMGAFADIEGPDRKLSGSVVTSRVPGRRPPTRHTGGR